MREEGSSNEQGRRYCPDRIVTCAAIMIKYAFRRLGRVPRKYFIIAARYFHNLAEYSTYRAMKMLFARRHFSSIIRSFSLSLSLFFPSHWSIDARPRADPKFPIEPIERIKEIERFVLRNRVMERFLREPDFHPLISPIPVATAIGGPVCGKRRCHIGEGVGERRRRNERKTKAGISAVRKRQRNGSESGNESIPDGPLELSSSPSFRPICSVFSPLVPLVCRGRGV